MSDTEQRTHYTVIEGDLVYLPRQQHDDGRARSEAVAYVQRTLGLDPFATRLEFKAVRKRLW